jgi:hypothetical protein
MPLFWRFLVTILVADVAAISFVHWAALPHDGSSIEGAIMIRPSEHQVQDEWAWLFEHHRGPRLPAEQALLCRENRLYERWLMGDPPNADEVYFDLGVNRSICEDTAQPTAQITR